MVHRTVFTGSWLATKYGVCGIRDIEVRCLLVKILDDGGDATQMMIQKFPGASRHMRGIVEDTITGVHR